MEGEDLFAGMDASFLEEAGATAQEDEQGTMDVPGFDPATGEVYGVDSSEKELKEEIEFVQDSGEQDEAGEGDEESTEEEFDENAPDSEESPSSPLTSLTSALREDGVLSSLTDEEMAEIKSGADLIEVIRKQIEANEYSDLTKDQQEYLKAMRAGVPDAQYREIKQSATQLANIDPAVLEGDDALEFRRKVLVQDFLSKGFDEADAKKYAGRSIDLGEDVEDSKKALDRLKQAEAAKLQQLTVEAEARNKAAQENYQKRLNELKVKVTSTKEILPDVKINEETQNKVYELMTKTAGFDRNNNPVNAVVKNMIEDQEYLIKLNYLHHLTDGLKDWSSLTGTVSSKAVNKLDAALAAQDARIRSGATEKRGKKGGASGLIGALDNIL